MQALFHGITIAAASGLLFGMAFKPDIAEGGLIPPQIQMAPAGDRQDGVGGDFAFAGRSGPLPDYVIGTDWATPVQPVAFNPADEAPAYADPTASATLRPVFAPAPIRTEIPRADSRLVQLSYPSMEGGVVPPRSRHVAEQITAADAPDLPVPPEPAQTIDVATLDMPVVDITDRD